MLDIILKEYYETLNPAEIERVSYLANDLKLISNKRQIKTFLDMGAGLGAMSAYIMLQFPESLGTLVDIEPQNTILKFVPDIEKRYEIFKWPCKEQLSGRQFDLVLAIDVLEHIPNYKKALLNVFQYVKENGYLYIQTPSNHPSPNFPTIGIWKNRILGLFGKNNPATHAHHGLSCKSIYDACKDDFEVLIAAEDYVVNGKVYCDFKPRTHLLLKKKTK